ncbi:MAG: histidine phosphatase family protein [Desulfocapsaceae bacterium]|jgi:broad specificity phosphatase PhoE|nr:histidine phosphatase family protein [Desulfocapsaceae bacterium]
MDIYFLRHGQTVSPSVYTGVTDVALSAHGESQIRSISAYLNNIVFDAAYCSPLIRCRTSFELLELEIACSFVEDLREINFGRWESKTFSEIYCQDRATMEQWFSQQEQFTFPEGDMISTFSNRIGNWLETLKTKQHEHVLVVSHSGVIRHALAHLLGLGINQADCFEITEGTVSLITVEKTFCILKLLNKNQ